MQIGLIKPCEEQKFEEEIKKGATIGVSVASLLDEIDSLEVRYAYDLAKILGEIKLNCMVVLGKVKINEDVKEAK